MSDDLRNLVGLPAEDIVIGGILFHGYAAYREVDWLEVADFTSEQKRTVFASIKRVGVDVDPSVEAIAHDLIEAGKLDVVGGVHALMDMHAQALPGLGLDRFAQQIRRARRAREIHILATGISTEIEANGLNGNAPTIAGLAQQVIDVSDQAGSRCGFRVDTLPPVLQDSVSIEYISQPELPRGAIVGVTGEPGCGKSSWATAMSRDANRTGTPVLILDRENPQSVVADRMRRLALDDSPLLRWAGGWVSDVPNLSSPEIRRWTQQCVPKPLIVIDSLIAFLESDENDSACMRRFMNECRKLADLGATVLLIHHTGKADSARDYRGSSDFKAAIDAGFHISNLGSDGRLDRLTVRCFKSRHGFAGSLIYTYSNGLFIRDERPQANARTEAQRLEDLLQSNPYSTGDKFEKLATQNGIGRNRARDFLRDGIAAKVIDFERSGKAQRYFLVGA